MYEAVFKPQSGKLLPKVSGTTEYLSIAPFLKYRCTQRLHSQKKEHESPRSAGKLRVPNLSIKKPFIPLQSKACRLRTSAQRKSSDYLPPITELRRFYVGILRKKTINRYLLPHSRVLRFLLPTKMEFAMSVNCQPLFLTETGKSFF